MDLSASSCSLVSAEVGATAVGTLTTQRQFGGVENGCFATALMGLVKVSRPTLVTKLCYHNDDAFYAAIKYGKSIILKCPNTNLGVLHTMVP